MMTEKITSTQKKQILRRFENGLNTFNLSEKAVQFIQDIKSLLMGLTISKDLYTNEEVESNYGYPKDYKPKPPEEQLEIWKKWLPKLSTDKTEKFIKEELPKMKLPKDAESWFVIPKWQKFGGIYNKAIDKMLKIFFKAKKGKFHNYRGKELGPDQLRETEKKKKFIAEISKNQPGDFIVIPAQLGLKYKGKSVRRARVLFRENEFGLGLWELLAILITHPERLTYEDLWIDCPGDQFRFNNDSVDLFFGAFYFYFVSGKVRLDAYRVDDVNEFYGLASAFFPQ